MIRSIFLIGIGCAFLTFGGGQLVHHAQAIRHMQEVSVPIVSDIPSLEQRLHILEQQAELSSFHASLREGSPEEYVHVYMLPQKTDLDRTLLIFETLAAQLEAEGHLKEMNGVSFKPLEDHGEYSVQPVSVQMTVNNEGLKDMMLFVRLAGIRTINDLLPDTERKQLVARSEEESPAGIVVLEEFFGSDLLTYARNAERRTLLQERMRQNFQSELFLQAFDNIVHSPLLQDIQRFLGGPLGAVLKQQKLWPMQFTTLEELTVGEQGDGWLKANVTVLLHTQD